MAESGLDIPSAIRDDLHLSKTVPFRGDVMGRTYLAFDDKGQARAAVHRIRGAFVAYAIEADHTETIIAPAHLSRPVREAVPSDPCANPGRGG
jgi:hypothetical protein